MSRLSHLPSLVAISLLLTATVVAQQAQERNIKKLSWPNEPVKLSKLKVKGKPVGLNQKFSADDDWLRGLIIGVKNMSSKTILFIELELDVIEPDDPGNTIVLAFPIAYGKMPPSTASPPDSPRLLPNETEDVTLSNENYDILRQLLVKVNYSKSIKQTEVVVRQVVFDDNTKWAAGALFRRSASRPNEWERIEIPESGNNKPSPGNGNLNLGQPSWLLSTSTLENPYRLLIWLL